jgi:SH3 domain protein
MKKVKTALLLTLTAGALMAETALAELAPEAIEIPTRDEVLTKKAAEARNTVPVPAEVSEHKAAAPAKSAPADNPAPESSGENAAPENSSPDNQHSAESSGKYVYVTENEGIWTTRGPGTEYKLIGTVRPGDRLEFISEKKNYYQVIKPNGQEAWIPKKYVQSEKSFRYQAEELAKENAELKYKLEHIDSESVKELRAVKKELEQIKTAHAALEREQLSQVEELKEARALKADLDAQLKTREQEMQIRWWKNGGLIAGAGAIMGVILVYLPRPRRRRDDDY